MTLTNNHSLVSLSLIVVATF